MFFLLTQHTHTQSLTLTEHLLPHISKPKVYTLIHQGAIGPFILSSVKCRALNAIYIDFGVSCDKSACQWTENINVIAIGSVCGCVRARVCHWIRAANNSICNLFRARRRDAQSNFDGFSSRPPSVCPWPVTLLSHIWLSCAHTRLLSAHSSFFDWWFVVRAWFLRTKYKCWVQYVILWS